MGFGKPAGICLVLAIAVSTSGCTGGRSRRVTRPASTSATPAAPAAVEAPVESAFVAIADDPVRARLLAAQVDLVASELSPEDDLSIRLERALRGLGASVDEAPASPEPTLVTTSELVSMLALTPASRSVLAPVAAALSGKSVGNLAHVSAALSASVGANVAAASTLREMELEEYQELADNDLLPLPEARSKPAVAATKPAAAAPAGGDVDPAPRVAPSLDLPAASPAKVGDAAASPDAALAAVATASTALAGIAAPAGGASFVAAVASRPVAPALGSDDARPSTAAEAASPAAVLAKYKSAENARADADASVTGFAASADQAASASKSTPALAAIIKPQPTPEPRAPGGPSPVSASGEVAPQGPMPVSDDDQLGRIATRVKWERDDLELVYQDTIDVAREDDPDATAAENAAYALCMTEALAERGSFEKLQEGRDRAFDELESDGTRGHCTAAALAAGSDHADARVWDGMWTKRQRSWMTTRCARDAARIYGTNVETERRTCDCLHAALAKRMSLDKLLRLDDQGFARLVEADAQLSACLGL